MKVKVTITDVFEVPDDVGMEKVVDEMYIAWYRDCYVSELFQDEELYRTGADTVTWEEV